MRKRLIGLLFALYAYEPELIIVLSGFDGGAGDPIGRQMLTSEIQITDN